MRTGIIAGLLMGLAWTGAAAQVPQQPRTPLLIVEGAEAAVELEEASIRVDAVGNIARTTIELLFRNPNARQLEGQLQFPLLPGQQVDGFALDIDGQMRDAVAVPKAKAQQVFEEVERGRIDPALLEKTEGNYFRLRVYPIPSRGMRRVRLVFLQALVARDGERRLRIPVEFAVGARRALLAVRGDSAPRISGTSAAMRFQREVDGATATLDSRAIGEGDALELRWPQAAGTPVMIENVDGQRYFHAEIPLQVALRPRSLPASVGLLWDASGSGRHRNHALEFALLDRYFRHAGNVEVKLWRLRDQPEPALPFSVHGGNWSALRRALEGTVYDGATDPAGWTPDADIGEYLLFSDGLFNFGERRFPALAAGPRVYAVNAAGAAADNDGLSALAEAHDGLAIQLESAADIGQAAASLLGNNPRVLSLQVEGAEVGSVVHAVDAGGALRVAGRLQAGQGVVLARIDSGDGQAREVHVPIATHAPAGPAARLWAGLELRRLRADTQVKRDAITALGMRFGLVTPGTSLLVLETAEDYAQYDIMPPISLRAAYMKLRSEQERDEAGVQRERMDAVAEAWAERVAWWERDWRKSPPEGLEAKDESTPIALSAPAPPAPASEPPVVFDEPAPVDVPRPEPTGNADRQSLDSVVVTGTHVGAPQGAAAVSIRLRPWVSDSPVARGLRAAPRDAIYMQYLREREANADSTAFYLDVADILFETDQPGLALRVLSNLAEMDLENRHVLRVHGYRLMQAGHPGLALPLFQRIAEMAPEEPQSFRDLGLAFAALSRHQQAIDALYKVVTGEWDERFSGIAEIALAELNAEVAKANGKVDLSRMDPRLLRNLPVGLRAVLTWDSDNSDMDLWVTDPSGEKCYYEHPLTRQGGRISNDFTGGYGPEEFVLRTPKPGKYRVEVNLYGDYQQLVAGATTLQIWLSTGFGSPIQHDRKVIVRLKEKSETVLVGEFEVE